MFALADKKGNIVLCPNIELSDRLSKGYIYLRSVRIKELNCHKVENGRELDDYIDQQEDLLKKARLSYLERERIVDDLLKLRKDLNTMIKSIF